MKTLADIIAEYPPRPASSVTDAASFYLLLSNGDLIGGEMQEHRPKHFNHSVILGPDNYGHDGGRAFYKRHEALRIAIGAKGDLYVDVLVIPNLNQRLAIREVFKTCGQPTMTWSIDPDFNPSTENPNASKEWLHGEGSLSDFIRTIGPI
jgi:hypothetical protein